MSHEKKCVDCGRVIMGKGHLGRCTYCFDLEAGKTIIRAAGVLAIAVIWKAVIYFKGE